MPGLLTIPTELRDEIWGYCLVSPSGYIETVRKKTAYYRRFPGATSSCPHHFLAIVNSPLEESVRGDQDEDYYSVPTKTPKFISLSLPRACRQIYAETKNLFWQRNTFHFRPPIALKVELDQRTGLGQWARRLITSVNINITAWDAPLLSHLEKLKKSGWNNSLKKVELVLTVDEVENMMRCRVGNVFCQATSSTLLEKLKAISEKSLFERAIFIKPGNVSMKPYEADVQELARKTARDIHLAWGGKLFYGSHLVLGTELSTDEWYISS